MKVAKKNSNAKQLPLNLLESVLEFLSLTGVSESSVRGAFEKAMKRTQSLRTRSRRPGASVPRLRGDASAYLLRLWHRDARFLSNDDFNPRPLPFSGGRVNLRSLIKQIDPDADPDEVLRAMLSVGLVRKTSGGRYLPTAKAAVLPTLHPWAIEHAAHSVMRLLSTVCRNAGADAKTPRLLERYSYVPDLKPEEARAFAEFSRSQGQVLLDILDDWLEQRRVTETSGCKGDSRGISAGIHLITFVGDDAPINPAAKGKKTPKKGGARVGAPNPPSTPA